MADSKRVQRESHPVSPTTVIKGLFKIKSFFQEEFHEYFRKQESIRRLDPCV